MEDIGRWIGELRWGHQRGDKPRVTGGSEEPTEGFGGKHGGGLGEPGGGYYGGHILHGALGVVHKQ